jgi:hypothetical protein
MYPYPCRPHLSAMLRALKPGRRVASLPRSHPETSGAKCPLSDDPLLKTASFFPADGCYRAAKGLPLCGAALAEGARPVLKPPATGDQGIARPPPPTGDMPVIKPDQLPQQPSASE